MTPTQTNKKPDVLVIGGGIIGMSTAYELAAKGANVTLIDKGEPGYGCSYGNAGWITPCFALPLPMPGMLLKSIGWLLNPNSPLFIKPQPSILLFRWLTRFMFSMNETHLQRSVEALTAISKFTTDAYAQLDKDFPGTIDFQKKGLLMVGQGNDGVKAAIHEMDLVAKHGIPGKLLDEKGVRDFEPALTGPLKGGVYFPEEAHGEPLAIVKAMRMAAEKHGAKILPFHEVFDFEITGRKVTRVRTTRGEFRPDQVVLATGSWSVPIAKQLGLNVPILGGKGYAWILKPFHQMPKVPMMLIEKKVAVTPRNGSIRLAGTLELVDRDESITPRRADNIIRGAREFMPQIAERPETLELWRGLRPCSPDGVPIIGYPKQYDNLLVLTGHQMLGLQSGAGSGRLAAELVLGQTPTFDPHPYRATRF